MTTTANQEPGAVEVTDVDSAAEAIYARMEQAEQHEEEPGGEEQASTGTEEETTEDADSDEHADDVGTEEEASEEDDNDSDEVESDDQEPSEEEGEELQLQTVEELAEALEMPLEDFLKTVKVTRKINGQEEEVTLAELREGNQREEDYRRKTMELSDKRREFDQQKEVATQHIGQQLQEASAMVANLEEQLVAEYKDVNWEELRSYDAGEYAAKKADFDGRRANIEAIKKQGQEAVLKLHQESQEKQKEQFGNYLTEQREALLNKLPDWKDGAKASAEQKAITSFLMDQYGFSNEEVLGKIDDHGNLVSPGMVDHRLILLARDAMQVNDIKSKTEIAKKKVKKLPKVLKPGAKQSKASAKAKQSAKLRSNLKRSGSVDDAAAAILDRMG